MKKKQNLSTPTENKKGGKQKQRNSSLNTKQNKMVEIRPKISVNTTNKIKFTKLNKTETPK